jgi:hypothetical protein
MAQMRGQGSYGMAAPNPFGGSSEDAAEQSPLDAIRQQTSKIEDLLDTLSEPIKPCVSLYLVNGHSRGPRLTHALCPTASSPPSAAS